MERIRVACGEGGTSLFVSGIDPGWAVDILPLLLSGVVSDIREVRTQEIFNYALYDQPDVVRKVIGFGESMDRLPMMLNEFALKMVWEPMVRLLGDGLGRPVDAVETFVERRPLTRTIQVERMGTIRCGHAGCVSLRGARPQRGASRSTSSSTSPASTMPALPTGPIRPRDAAVIGCGSAAPRICTSPSTATTPASPGPPAAAMPAPRIAS